MTIARFAAALLSIVLAGQVPAQSPEVKEKLRSLKPTDFPTRPIQLNVGTPAGGGMDLTARLLARKITEYTGEQVVVHNRPGAGGMINNEWLINQASKDGYQIGILNNAIIADTYLRAKGKWSYKDLDNLAFINYEPVVWLTSNSGRFGGKPLAQILAAAKEGTEPLRVASVPGTLFEMLAEQVESATGAPMTKVLYHGGGQSLVALMGNHIDVSYGFFGEFESLRDRVRPVAVAASRPVEHLPGVPTFNEVLKRDDIEWIIWRYVAAPKGMPPERRAWLVAVLDAVLSDPELVAEYRRRGSVMERKGLESPEAVTRQLERLAAEEEAFYRRTGRLSP